MEEKQKDNVGPQRWNAPGFADLGNAAHRRALRTCLVSLLCGVCGTARAGDTTLTLQGYTSGAFRWKDVAANLYSASCG